MKPEDDEIVTEFLKRHPEVTTFEVYDEPGHRIGEFPTQDAATDYVHLLGEAAPIDTLPLTWHLMVVRRTPLWPMTVEADPPA